MTISQLLSHHGFRAPRWVDVNGQVSFDAPSTATATLTPMAPHTFHGGRDRVDAQASVTSWWQDADEVARHTSAVNRAFPGFVSIPSDDDLPPAFGGVIDTGRGSFTVLVMLRRDGDLPSVRVLNRRLGRIEGRRWRPSPHLYLSGALCVAAQDDWIVGEHTAATVIAWTAHWLAAYTEWRFSGQWPVDGYLPDAA